MQRRDADAPLSGVHVSIDHERRLLERRAGGFVRQRHEPDRAAFGRRTDALDLHEIRSRVRPHVKELRQLVVAKDVIEG